MERHKLTKIIAKILTFLGGLYFFLEFLLPEEIKFNDTVFKFGKHHQEISIGLALLSSFAIGLGVLNLLLVHGVKVVRSKKNILPSAVLLISFFITLIVQISTWVTEIKVQNTWSGLGSIGEYVSTPSEISLDEKIKKLSLNLTLLRDSKLTPDGVTKEEYQSFIQKLSEEVNKEQVNVTKTKAVSSNFFSRIETDISDFKKNGLIKYAKLKENTILWKLDYLIFYGLFLPLGSSMFSILGFYITYAAFRSFRVRSIESAVMMLAALVIILGQIPQGVMYISQDLPHARLWIIQYISTPAFRAIYFCSALAGLSLAVRMWFSMDKNPFMQR
jgi:hypothetical protein